ncbi:MAG: hypothetical protein BTN85_0796 [Candidatus Methanohalarchaeum thermophilum]|uniref:DUF4062 domain-containing protein n=1 Tax=Methanohalarchaeum thermophilum TaxID=1903181 RepID=A0A1Q6DVE0_METT1|nr:MAG: hypothetical protein BTN85_0796 [Candidatus Methanohalarchaeum thermophilum]
MNQKLKVFISSSFKLKDERSIAKSTIENKIEFLDFSFEEIGANSIPPMKVCLERVKESDVYVGILSKELTDPTKKEFKIAKENQIPQLLYIRETSDRKNEMKDFLNKIKDSYTYYKFEDVKEFQEQLKRDLGSFLLEKFYDLRQLEGSLSREQINEIYRNYGGNNYYE